MTEPQHTNDVTVTETTVVTEEPVVSETVEIDRHSDSAAEQDIAINVE